MTNHSSINRALQRAGCHREPLYRRAVFTDSPVFSSVHRDVKNNATSHFFFVPVNFLMGNNENVNMKNGLERFQQLGA